MKITWSKFHEGENDTRPIHLYVDEPYRTFDIYVYMIPVGGGNSCVSRNPIPLDENGEADYAVPGDVLTEAGYFQAQIVAIGPNEKIVKSDTETIPTGESVPDKSAVLPTGEVITLVDVKAELDSLTASSIPYTDTEEIGVDNVQDAIDYALIHGSGGSIPIYTLYWYSNPTPEERDANLAIINQLRDKEVGSYRLYLAAASRRVEVSQIVGGTEFYFIDAYDTEILQVYAISSRNPTNYEQSVSSIPSELFDPTSPTAASMYATAEYISERIGTSGNLDPDSYASASDVDAIESKIPSAASAQNQLADKNFVASELSGKQDTLTEAEQSAVDSGITSEKVSAYDTHVADTTIHVTETDKTNWNAKYDKPANGIPSSDMTSAVQTSLGLADTALQSVPAGYATETYVDTAISTAIGNAIGGSY